MDKQYTLAEAQAYCAEHAAEMRKEYDASYFPDLPKAWEVWQAGCFLGHYLSEHGCQDEQRHKILFAAGQRGAYGDPWEWALNYLNEFVAAGRVQDQPGEKLADEIFRAAFKTGKSTTQ